MQLLVRSQNSIFIDETGFKGDLANTYFWTKKGRTTVINSVVRTQNVSVVCAITNNEIIGFQIFKGLASNDFGCFLVELLLNNSDILEDIGRYVFVLDNASIHKADNIKILLSFILMQFLSRYSPFLNPIEELFSQWKHFFKNLFSKSLSQVVYNIYKSSENLEFRLLFKLFHHSLIFYPLCLRNVSIN